MAEKVTEMVLKVKVDLQCPCSYKKVNKILCKFPQIRDQKYDEKANTVKITVVCCSPEKLRDKLLCKGSKVFISIEIIRPSKPTPTPTPTPTPVPTPPQSPLTCVIGRGPECSPPDSPRRTCCRRCYEGHDGGPCYHGYGVPPPPQPCYGGYFVYGYSYGPVRPCHVGRCDNYYYSGGNPPVCSIM